MDESDSDLNSQELADRAKDAIPDNTEKHKVGGRSVQQVGATEQNRTDVFEEIHMGTWLFILSRQ